MSQNSNGKEQLLKIILVLTVRNSHCDITTDEIDGGERMKIQKESVSVRI